MPSLTSHERAAFSVRIVSGWPPRGSVRHIRNGKFPSVPLKSDMLVLRSSDLRCSVLAIDLGDGNQASSPDQPALAFKLSKDPNS